MPNDCQQICQLMQQLVPEYNKAMAKKFTSVPVTPSQAELLMSLDKNGSQKISELAQHLNMVDSNVSNICSRLEKLHYVERVRQRTDQRVVKIHLTPLAQKQVVNLKLEEEKFVEQMNRLISPVEIDSVNAGLTRLNQLLVQLNQKIEMEEITK
ncbi:MarR family winged helix-turn-helix transcriptional regulator [Liquorilactobacillus satsumensis]|nr:MarR family transcriptional regulator [Liquorilactobacillus satsumensis]MCP9328701.1 MarR family transcriptional regulator [Liquorilactobacillus satsumensis]